MASKNRVIWKEGMSVSPQHFQQQQRHIDYLVSFKSEATINYGYGFSRLQLDLELLKLGRIGITEALGIMPDGTLFEIPYQDIQPQPIEIKQLTTSESKNIYLALPIMNEALSEVDSALELSSDSCRYKKTPIPVKDLHTKGGSYIQLDGAQLAPKIVQGSDDLNAYTILPLCRIKELRTDGTIILDEDFIPTISKVRAAPHLQNFLEEVANLVAERARQLSEKIGAPTQQGVAGIAEFLMLQLLNAAKPRYRHLAYTKMVHPETLYLILTQTCSELMTFTSESKIAIEFKQYNHDDLTNTFKDLILATRQALSIVLTPRAVSIPLSEQNGMFIGTIQDQELLKTANFVLAVKTQIPQEQLIRTFVQQTKIGSSLTIEKLVRVQLTGIPLVPLSAAPPQLPFHAGYTYFQLDTHAQSWEDIIKTNSIAFHVAGNFPELQLQFWAVRSK
ncbi:type VI secretion system baseplate subunit TssK [Frischella perrara]|jgi:type VI secretion protein, VC_A0114 family|uniref:Type VI secretion protein n=1 Tax=Frischella perrara TaxID=1267021 RepID=A0A0A7S8F9_FRIPE|nr:type VI secretion system baseplate subunit TssK [Frischella perrara]AJA45566.1 type VI secretion protein [Frischella perrara]PWV58981.1 type VI secretion system protein ImpJ [Frischella perrara]